MNTMLRFLGLALSLSIAACVAASPEQETDTKEVAEAESAVVTYCISTCGCPLAHACIIWPGQWYGICERDLAGPSDPAICFEDCQCPKGSICDATMHCSAP